MRLSIGSIGALTGIGVTAAMSTYGIAIMPEKTPEAGQIERVDNAIAKLHETDPAYTTLTEERELLVESNPNVLQEIRDMKKAGTVAGLSFPAALFTMAPFFYVHGRRERRESQESYSGTDLSDALCF